MRRSFSFLQLIISLIFFNQVVGQITGDGKIDRGDFFLHYKVYGSNGPYLILLSGGPGSDNGYLQPLADTLSKFYRCVMLEQRGTGRSVMKKYDSSNVRMELYVDDVEALRLHLKADKVHVLGHSWGGLLALLYGIRYARFAEKMIVMGPGPVTSAYASIFNDNLRRAMTEEELTLRAELKNAWRKYRHDTARYIMLNHMFDVIGMPAYYYDRKIGAKAASLLQPSDYNFYVSSAFFQAHPQWDVRPQLQNISCPLLILMGRQDPGAESNVSDIHRLVPGSKLVFVEQCGHSIWEEKPAEMWKAVFDFLNSKNNSR